MELFLSRVEPVLDAPENSLGADTRFQELDSWDSLALLSLISIIDEEYNLVLSPHQIIECQNLGDLHSLVTGGTAF